MDFASLGLGEVLLQAIRARHYGTPTPVQAQVIPAVLAGQDVLAAAPTGTGKTAAFALPLLQQLGRGDPARANAVRALVLVPTRELAQQVSDSFRAYGSGQPLRIAVAYGGASINPQMMALRKGADVLVATPGRLLDLHRQNAIRLGQLQVLVLDEADRLLELGFSREIDPLLALLPKRRQTLLFSATLPAKVRDLALRFLQQPLMVDASPHNSVPPAVEQWLVKVAPLRKTALLLHLLKVYDWPQVLVFANTRKRVDHLVQVLRQHGVPAEALHGDKGQAARLSAINRFREGGFRVLVATDVATRGLDIRALPVVVNIDLPRAAEDHVHRIGRTGRAGARGLAVSLCSADEAPRLQAIEALLQQPLPHHEEPGFAAGPG